jgi:hypothetical protein
MSRGLDSFGMHDLKFLQHGPRRVGMHIAQCDRAQRGHAWQERA